MQQGMEGVQGLHYLLSRDIMLLAVVSDVQISFIQAARFKSWVIQPEYGSGFLTSSCVLRKVSFHKHQLKEQSNRMQDQLRLAAKRWHQAKQHLKSCSGDELQDTTAALVWW